MVFKSRWRDLNPRPLDYESSALPLSHIGNTRFFIIAGELRGRKSLAEIQGMLPHHWISRIKTPLDLRGTGVKERDLRGICRYPFGLL